MAADKHPLRRFLNEHQLSVAELARDMNVQRSTIYTLMAGDNCTLDLAYRIVQRTQGEITLNELARHLKSH